MAAIDIRTRLPLVSLPNEEDVVEEIDATPADILAQCLETACSIKSLVVMSMDTSGVIGFVSNLDGLAETNLFIDLVKMKSLVNHLEVPPTGGGATA